MANHFLGKRGAEMPWWKGGRTKSVSGYVIRQVGVGHPLADKHGRVYEHRLVMSEMLGRPLSPLEHVHHINGDKTDNRIENLRLFSSTQEHHRHHTNERVDFEAIKRLRDAGLTKSEMARTLGVPRSTLRYRLSLLEEKSSRTRT